jgi:hypothetical protein
MFTDNEDVFVANIASSLRPASSIEAKSASFISSDSMIASITISA